MSSSHSTPHDALFKWTFSAPARAAEELRAVLPAELSALLSWDTMRPEHGEYVDEELRGRHADLLFSVQVQGRTALLYLLFEHQSTPDPRMPVRLLIYLARIWSDWLRDHPSTTRVPPILPVVLHHGVGGWTAPRELGDMYDADPELLAAAAPYLPTLRLLIDDVASFPDETLRARAASALVKLVLLALKHGRDAADLAERLARWADLVAEVAAASHGLDALVAVVRYLFEVNEHISREAAATVLRSALGARADEVVMTVGQQLIEQGRREGTERGIQQGLQQGIEQGIEQGLVVGRRELLLRLLRRRFGDLPEELVTRLSCASAEQLDGWGERFATAQRLDEVFGHED
jgi:predicted transposase/invertase (TIGR01784 family)